MKVSGESVLKQIFAFVGWSAEYHRRVMSGVLAYADEHAQWDLTNVGRSGPEGKSESVKSKPDGMIILDLLRAPRDKLLRRYPVPVVNLFDYFYQAAVNIYVDDECVGQTVAAYFLDRRYEHFAYVGLQDHSWSDMRELGYRHILAGAGCGYDAYHIGRKYYYPIGYYQRLPEVDSKLVRWLSRQPKPLALFAGNDITAMLVSYACRAVKLKVPADVAIVGVDNDELWCGTMRPRLSSVAVPWRHIGYLAAQWLDRLMLGEVIDQPHVIQVKPGDIVTRQSSDFTAVNDPDLKDALVYLRQHACRPVSVDDILEAVPISRRRLERLFSRHIGHSPFHEIRRLQIERARRLLVHTELSMPQIAVNSGLNPDNFSKIFRQHTGLSPREYRKQTHDQ